MNEIKIYLKTSGSIAELYKDFNLYRGSYSNVQISIFVPVSLLYENTEGTFLNAIKTGAILTTVNGAKVTTKSYYAEFVKTTIYNNVEYALYTQTLPKEYVVYAGNQTIVCNIVNIDNTDSDNPVIISVTTTQTASFIVSESAYLESDEPIEPSQLELLEGKIDTLGKDIVGAVESAESAAESELNAAESAESAVENANKTQEIYESILNGDFGTFYGMSIVNGDLIIKKPKSNNVDFSIDENGHLIIKV